MADFPANHLQPQKWLWREEPADSCWSLQAGGQTPSALWVCSLSLFLLLLLLTPPCQRDVLSAPFQGHLGRIPGTSCPAGAVTHRCWSGPRCGAQARGRKDCCPSCLCKSGGISAVGLVMARVCLFDLFAKYLQQAGAHFIRD